MPKNQDLTDDINILTPGPTESQLSRQFTHPGYTFKGQPLQPYTAGTDLLFNQVLDRTDAALTIFLGFIFIHVKDRKELVTLCWDKVAFRAALLEWIDSLGPLSSEDKKEATRLFEDMRARARESSIEVVPEPHQKKTRAKRQARSPS